MKDNVLIGLLIVFLIAVVILAPFATIWSLNTLFALNIAYTFWTWLAAVWLSTVTVGAVTASKRQK